MTEIRLLIPNRDSPNGYSTVVPAELQSVTFSHQVDPHKTLTTHKLACCCFAAIFGHQYSKLIPQATHSSLLTLPMMNSTVPSVEDFTNAFSNHLTPIVGEPTYQTLKELKDQLKANAASIPTTLGGSNHGYLGLIFSPAAYATISPTAFVEPAYPGQHHAIATGTNAANTSAIIRRHTKDTRQWRVFKNLSTALKNQLLSAVDDIYVRTLRDRHVGYMNRSIRNLLIHLFNNYGNITQLELEDNDTKIRSLWDPTALLTASSNNSRMVKITLTMAANHTRPTNSSASRTPLFSKLGCISKTAKPGTQNPTMKKHGPTSKRISNAHNVFSVTSFAQPNKLASLATLQYSTTPTTPNHHQNIATPL